MSSGSSRLSFVVILIVFLVAIAASTFYLILRPGDDPGLAGGNGGGGGGPEGGTPTSYTADDYAGFYELKNKGLAWLENKEFTHAEQTFLALHEAQPDELLPLRNLAITQTMMVADDDSLIFKDRTKNPSAWNDAVTAARETLQELAKRDEPLSQLLAGHISLREGATRKGIGQLEAAARGAKTDASYWFDVYDAHGELKEAADGKPYPLAVEAIETAYKLQPENLHAIGEVIQTQARAASPKLIGTLTAARPVVEPLAESIKKRTRFEILDRFDAAIEALKADPTKTVFARQIANVLRPDIAKRIDQRTIDKVLLEYVAIEFGDAFDAKAKKAGFKLPQQDAIPVKFKPTDEQLPDIAGATDVQIADMNLDGVPDIVVVRADALTIHARRSDKLGIPSGPWTQIGSVTAPDGARFTGVTLADIDRDHEDSNQPRDYQVVHEGTGVPRFDQAPGHIFTDTDLDVIAFGTSGVYVFRNNRGASGSGISFQRTFDRIDVADPKFSELRDVADVAVTDMEHDGDLDLVIGSASGLSFWMNQSTRQDVRFANGDSNVGPVPEGHTVRAVLPVDWNRDIANDLVVITDKSVGLMQNILHGRFRWRELADEGGTGGCVGDFNGDAAWDLIVTSDAGVAVRLLSPATDEGTTWLSSAGVSAAAAGRAVLLDYDNDGFRDAAVLGPDLKLLRGESAGAFTAADVLDAEFSGVTACDAGDLDLDGDLDLVVADQNGVQVLTNDGGNKNNWFRLTLRPEPNPEQFPASRVNMHGFGSVLELKAGSRYQARVVSEPVTHFGLGQRPQADVLRIIWTDGIPQNLVDDPMPKNSLTVLAPQYLGGSCPYIYTWNGERFVFYSDCLWAAPLGLQQAEGVFAPSREWEYVKIDGHALKPRNEHYELQITEELWEATYLDQVKLIAVDHPAGTQIYSNEKVGPPALTEFRIHTTQTERKPVSATDQNGRDLLAQLKAVDGNYVRAFDRRIRQGLTSEHFIELDLGEIENPEQLTLFLVGWVFPTDTNINIGIDQTGEAPPRPPSIQVPDENGNWVEAIPFAGFPGGKTKTIAIDLSSAFRSDDYRVRLVSSMELYWDAAFFTVNEQPVEIRQTELPLVSADLHYRGFSKRTFSGSVFTTSGFGPESYDYEDVHQGPVWLPMDGRFTRFGDVTPLLTDRDDFQVVFGAGDEVTLRFRADTADVPDGWVRDFLLYNVGWDKDVKQNTVYGQTVEPLPSAGMKSYTGSDPTFPDTEKHREFLRKWQTRTQSSREFRNWVREFDTSGRKSSE